MQDLDFENTRKFLLSKLPEYLKTKGININSNFNCVNPRDLAHLPSMSYNAETNTVRCFHCNANYNIFDLIGLDENITDYSRQFARAYEMFVGKIPFSLMDKLKAVQDEQVRTTIKRPTFEIANDSFGSSQDSSSPFSIANDAKEDSYRQDNPNHFNAASPFEEARLRPYNQRQATPSNINPQNFDDPFGQIQGLNAAPQNQSANNEFSSQGFGSINDQFHSQVNQNHTRFGDNQLSPFGSINHENAFDFTDYVNQCSSNVGKTSYFKDRGLSENVIQRFRLGFDEKFVAEIDKLSGQPLYWKAAIIPYGVHGYCVRNTDLESDNKNERYKKKGFFDIYNHEVLIQPGTIFITEGEFDALSLETLGYKALALGGIGNVRQLLNKINESTQEHTFYICLDDDEPGHEATTQLAQGLAQLNKKFKCVNLAYPYKDINECLYKAHDILKQRVDNLEQILSNNFKSVINTPNFKYIQSTQDLLSLNLSNTLYSICAKPQITRRFIAQMIRNKLTPLFYAGSLSQWLYISNLVTLDKSAPFNQNEWEQVKFVELKQDNIQKQLVDGIESHIIQGITRFVTLLDLSAYTDEAALSQVRSIASIVDELGVPVIVMCNDSITDSVEALSLQNINVYLQENGDFLCQSIDKQGHPISFIQSLGV